MAVLLNRYLTATGLFTPFAVTTISFPSIVATAGTNCRLAPATSKWGITSPPIHQPLSASIMCAKITQSNLIIGIYIFLLPLDQFPHGHRG